MRRSALVVVPLLVAAACSGSGASDQVVAAPPSTTTTAAPPVTLPDLPPAGMVVQRGEETIVLTAEDGTVLHELPGHDLDSRSRPGSIYLWRSGEGAGGRALRFDPAGSLDPISLRPEDPADWPTDPAPIGGAGHWRWLEPSADGSLLLGQWSSECEVPMAFFVEGGVARPVVAGSDGPPLTSHAMGWLSDGRAAVAFPESHCGTGIDRPGIYAVSTDGGATFLTEGDRGMTWGSP